MNGLINEGLDDIKMVNILLHGVTDKVTILLGTPAMALALLADSSWLGLIAPFCLVLGGMVKYWYDIKLKREQISAILHKDDLNEERQLLEIEKAKLELDRIKLEMEQDALNILKQKDNEK